MSAPLNVYHVISGEELLEMLRRVADGEDPDLVYIESYVNAERPDDDPKRRTRSS